MSSWCLTTEGIFQKVAVIDKLPKCPIHLLFRGILSCRCEWLIFSEAWTWKLYLTGNMFDWFGQQVTRHSQLRCTTWTPTSWTPTPWHWRLLGRSFRTTTVTRCSPLWALEPNCLLMDGCHMSFHWWSQPPLFPLCDHFFMLLASNLNSSEFYF